MEGMCTQVEKIKRQSSALHLLTELDRIRSLMALLLVSHHQTLTLGRSGGVRLAFTAEACLHRARSMIGTNRGMSGRDAVALRLEYRVRLSESSAPASHGP